MNADRSGANASDEEPDRPEPGVSETVPAEWLERLFHGGQVNALIAWAMVAVLVAAVLESLFEADVLTVALTAAITGIVVAPAVAARDPRVMLPWELLLIATLPVLTRALLGGEVGVFATYLAIAALALVITVELQLYTALRVTRWFAVVLVVLTTMATAAAWTVLRWYADRLLGTAYLTTNEALMAEWLYVTLAGVAGGILFVVYFRRRDLRLRRALRWVVRR